MKRNERYQQICRNVLKSMAAGLLPAAMLSGCSPESEPASPSTQHSISFSASEGVTQQVEGTRADNSTSLNERGINKIKVYGYKYVDNSLQNVMPGYTLTYTKDTDNSSTTNSSGWEYVSSTLTDYLGNPQEIKYWDGNSTNYRFFGVPATDDASSTYNLQYYASESATTATAIDKNLTSVASNGVFKLSFSGMSYKTRKKADDGTYTYYDGETTTTVQQTSFPYFCHLWQGNPANNYNKPVTLEFTTPYALVKVVFVRPAGTTTTQLGNPDESGNSHDITFAPVDTTNKPMTTAGSITISYPMAADKTTEEYTSEASSSTSTSLTKMSLGTMELTHEDVEYQTETEYVMIPTKTNGDFKCTAYVYDSSKSGDAAYVERTAVVPAQYMQWRPGYQYTYIFKVSANNGMEFSHVLEVYTKWQAGYVDNPTW